MNAITTKTITIGKTIKVSKKPRVKLIIDDDDETPIVVNKKTGKIIRVEFYFPEEVWNMIKDYADYGKRKQCRFHLCDDRLTRAYPHARLIRVNRENQSAYIKLHTHTSWLCDACIVGQDLDPKEYDLQVFRSEQVGKRAMEKTKKTNKGHARTNAIWQLKRKLEKISVDENMKDLEKNYWKPYIASLREQQKIDQMKEDLRFTDSIERKARKQRGLDTKEGFIRELAQMLTEGTIEIKLFQRIMSQALLYDHSYYEYNDWRERIMNYAVESVDW